jgi:hypothetical protein
MRILTGLSLILWLSLPVFATAATAAKSPAKSTTNTPSNANGFSTIIEPYGQIFPAFELASLALSNKSQASNSPNTFGTEDSLIGASVIASKANEALTLSISAPGLLKPSSLSARAPRAGQRYTLYPNLRWNVQALRAVKQPRIVTLTFELYSGKSRLAVRSVPVTLRSSNDVLYGVKDPTSKKILDFNWLFAAFVDEDSPAITDVLAKSTTTGVIEKFHGYGQNDTEEVYAQVFAIWHTLQRRGIRYSNLAPVTSSFKSQNVSSQYVRFVSDTWASQKANCVDASVLIASALRRAGLAPVLVVIPGHMLVGVALNAEGTQYAYLETTRLETARISSGTSPKRALSASLENFEEALAEGQRQVDAAGARFDAASDLSYQIIDIQAARELGVMPISQR